jgi:hypothetical protein
VEAVLVVEAVEKVVTFNNNSNNKPLVNKVQQSTQVATILDGLLRMVLVHHLNMVRVLNPLELFMLGGVTVQ